MKNHYAKLIAELDNDEPIVYQCYAENPGSLLALISNICNAAMSQLGMNDRDGEEEFWAIIKLGARFMSKADHEDISADPALWRKKHGDS